MDNIVNEYESSKSMESSDEDHNKYNLSPDPRKRNECFSYSYSNSSNSSTALTKETNLSVVKSKNSVFVNSRIFSIDDR
jgi:hypothetical protein